MTRRISLTCALALMAVTLVASEAAAQRGRGRGWGQGGSGQGLGRGYGQGGYGRGCLFGPRMACELEITAAQQKSIDKLYARAADKVVPLLRDLDRAEIELSALIVSGEASDSDVQRLRKKSQDLDVRIDDIWLKYRQQVLALLTPEQRQRYEKLTVGFGSYGCWGRGPGWGRGMGRRMGW